MAVNDTISETTKPPQIYKMEISDPNCNKEKSGSEICETKQLIGLTKEQLEQYRNDPFWKFIRYTMLVLFWIAWTLMFASAVALVIFSPKCVLKKEPEWWRKHISYQIFTPSFRDSNSDGIGDFNGIREKLNALRKVGIQTIWVTPVIVTQKDDFNPLDVIDFTTVDERFGTMDDFKMLIDEAHRLDMRLTMDLPISTTSVSHKWFKSAQTNDDYVDYYIWKKSSDVSNDQHYVTENGKEYAYLAFEKKHPILNWDNPAVRKHIVDAAKIFLNMGVDGFHIAYINQIMGHHSSLLGHGALIRLSEFIMELREYINQNETLPARELAVFSTLSDLTEIHDIDTASYSLSNVTYVIDNSVTKINNRTCVEEVSHCFYTTLITSLQRFEDSHLPHAWQFTNYQVSRLSTRFDKPTADLFTLVQLSLPGAIELYYGQELNLEDTTDATNKFTGLMQWDDSHYAGFTAATEKPFFSSTTNYKEDNFEKQLNAIRSPLKTLKAVAKLRQHDDNFALGETRMAPLIQDVILFSRFHRLNNATSGKVYVIAANFGTTIVEVNGTLVVPDDRTKAHAEIAAATLNADKNLLSTKKVPQLEKFLLGPKQGVVFKI